MQDVLLNFSFSFTAIGSIEAHDYVFWYGDLNYRLELEKEKAESMIQEADWKVCWLAMTNNMHILHVKLLFFCSPYFLRIS